MELKLNWTNITKWGAVRHWTDKKYGSKDWSLHRINSTAVVPHAISLLILTKHNRRMEGNMTLCIY